MDNLFNRAPCLYYTVTENGTLSEVNSTLCLELDYQFEELRGKKMESFFTLPSRIFLQTHLMPLLRMQGHADEIYITLQSKSAVHIPVLMNVKRIESTSGIFTIYTGIIVHSRKKFEDELVAARRAAETALLENTTLEQMKKELQNHTKELEKQMFLVNKQNEELRQINRVITHDLREPIRKLFVFTNLLSESKDEIAKQKAVSKINSITNQMGSLISGLQQYVWLTEAASQYLPVNLGKLVLLVKRELETDDPEIDIELEMEELPVIQADQEQIQLLLYQLLANAVRFKKPGKDVRVVVTADRFMQNIFRNVKDKYQYEEYLRLQIRDTGMGFDNLYKDQVFDIFRRLHAESGQGIGLSLCKKVVENHKGSISIESETGEGTIVTILLPLSLGA